MEQKLYTHGTILNNSWNKKIVQREKFAMTTHGPKLAYISK